MQFSEGLKHFTQIQ